MGDLFLEFFDGWYLMAAQLVVGISAGLVVAIPLSIYVMWRVYPRMHSHNLRVLTVLALVCGALLVGLLAIRIVAEVYGPTTHVEEDTIFLKNLDLMMDIRFCQTGYILDGEIHYTARKPCGR